MPLINNKSDEKKLKKSGKKIKRKKVTGNKIFRKREEDKLKIKNAKNQN